MAITDIALNPIQPGGTVGGFLGWAEPEQPYEELNLDMYEFIIQEIRSRDAKEGFLFLKRFLAGPQTMWGEAQEKIFDLKNLWSVTDCPDELLVYLKQIVGWTPKLKTITDGLDASALRRLIRASVPLWKSRTSENAIVDVINLLVARRARVLTWFDFRWITGKTFLGEQFKGRDPWLIQFPGGGLAPEQWSTIRVVTPANKQLLRDVLELMRPVGERFAVVYLAFMDLFTIEDDLSQWNRLWGTQTPGVIDGVLSFAAAANAQSLVSNVAGATAWSSYMVTARLRAAAATVGGGRDYGHGLLLSFNPTSGNGYAVVISIAGQSISLWRVTGGAFTLELAHQDLDLYHLPENFWHGVRVEVVPDGGNARVKVFLDGVQRIDATDGAYGSGTVGLMVDTSTSMDCDEIEVMGLPVDSETIEPN